jgi:hypothetical protein
MMLNQKAPGRYQITNFGLKQLTATQIYLATLFNKMTQEGKVPEWLMTGVTILISKNENSENQGITYLPTVYKTITSITSK